MADALGIWLYDRMVARVTRTRNGRLRLTYTDAALQSHDLGEPLLSCSLPVSPDPFPNQITNAFLAGLLPEEDVLRAVAAELDLRPRDTYALIGALGRDCAGALVIQPEHAPPPQTPSVYTAERLSAEELARLIDNLRIAPLGIDRRVRLSLGGAQEKLPLTLISEGVWGRPIEGTPSTHILKPQIRGLHHTVENEAFCLRVAGHSGLRAAAVAVTTVLGRSLLVVQRYDRLVQADGTVQRLHQEDSCQALGFPPRKKYQEDGGPSLRQVAGLVQAVAPRDDLDDLVRAVVLNVVLGNGDAHGKNFSLVHEPAGGLRLAPLYDVLCTSIYGQNRLAMYIDSVQRVERVTVERIVNEATGWGMPRSRAREIVADFLARIPRAVDRAAGEITGVPPDLLDFVVQQLERVAKRESEPSHGV